MEQVVAVRSSFIDGVQLHPLTIIGDDRGSVLQMLRSVVGMDQVLFGSDYPYLRRDLAVACRHEVETSAELEKEESRAVLAGNAQKLFPRLAKHAATRG